MLIGKKVEQGALLPPLYGVSYRDAGTYEAVCHPIPFNWIIGAIRGIWWRLKIGFKPALYEKMLSQMYTEGLRKGAEKEAEYALDRIRRHAHNADAWHVETQAWLERKMALMDKEYKKTRRLLNRRLTEEYLKRK
jgi:hypothetical protein